MTIYNRAGMLYARISGKRISTKLKYSKENRDIFYSEWIQDHKKANRFRKFAIVSFVINLVLLMLFCILN